MKIEKLKEYIKNREKEDKGTDCEQILGSMASVDNCALFYKNNKQDILLIEAGLLHDFVTTQNFNEKELLYYRMGLNAFVAFLHACEDEFKMRIEREKIRLKEEEEKKKQP